MYAKHGHHRQGLHKSARDGQQARAAAETAKHFCKNRISQFDKSLKHKSRNLVKYFYKIPLAEIYNSRKQVKAVTKVYIF